MLRHKSAQRAVLDDEPAVRDDAINHPRPDGIAVRRLLHGDADADVGRRAQQHSQIQSGHLRRGFRLNSHVSRNHVAGVGRVTARIRVLAGSSAAAG